VNAEQKVARLESLLERIQQNRTAAPVSLRAVSSDASHAEAAEPTAAERPTPVPSAAPTPVPVAAPTPVPAPQAASAAIIEPQAPAPTPTPATPMEQAMAESGEIDLRDQSDPELEITYPDDDDEPEITFDEPTPVPEAAPTAPVHTRSPEPAEPRRIQTSAARASSPIARVISRHEPKTFGELLDRALALRPR